MPNNNEQKSGKKEKETQSAKFAGLMGNRVVRFFLVLFVYLWAEEGGPVADAQVRAQTPIVTNVELVQIPVTIFEDKGAVATGLKKSEFRLFEDGVEQDMLYFERERVLVSFVILA